MMSFDRLILSTTNNNKKEQKNEKVMIERERERERSDALKKFCCCCNLRVVISIALVCLYRSIYFYGVEERMGWWSGEDHYVNNNSND